MEILAKRLPALVDFAASGELQTTLVLIPESSRKSNIKAWSTNPITLKPRQMVEEVMAETDDSPASKPPSPKIPFYPSKAEVGAIAACYQSKNSCTTATNSCSGHGVCEDRYAKAEPSPEDAKCFACRCQGTEGTGEKGSHAYTHWAGPTCAKIDVSVPFWLFTGLTIAIVTVLGLAIGLLFSVGEEKLPGVIGAGVSKSK